MAATREAVGGPREDATPLGGPRHLDADRVGLYVGAVLVLAGVYELAARASLELLVDNLEESVAAIWLPVGVGVVALALFGLRFWPGIVIGDVLVADTSQPLGTILGQTVGNTIAVVVAAALLVHLTRGRTDLARVVDVFSLVVCAVVAAGLSALFGPPSLWLGDVIAREQLDDVFRTWFLSDLSGALVVMPFLLVWARGRVAPPSWLHAAEGVVLLALLVLLVELPTDRDVPYVVFPALIWAALRFGPRGAATAILLVTSLMVWNTAQEQGPFVRETVGDSALANQLFIAVSALTSLILAGVMGERRRAGSELRSLAEEQAALRRVATLVAGDAEPAEVFERVTKEAARVLDAPHAAIVRFADDRTGTVVGVWAAPGRRSVQVGESIPLDGDTVVARVHRAGQTERVESYDELDDPLARTMHDYGYRSAVGAPIKLGGRLWGAVAAATAARAPLPEDAEQRLCDFAELVAQALANADAYEKLAASRARIVGAGDAERRRLERNLHDGAQQRLVALALQLRLVDAKMDRDPEAARELLAGAHGHLEEALDELRELARGIHPAILTDRGLAPALESLVARAPVPVEIASLPEDRLPEPVEAAVYYVVAEALTNAAKYAQASRVSVTVQRQDGSAVVRVADDGVGGADPAAGSGLRGLADRLEALSGRLRVDSAPHRGTRIEAEIPLSR